MIELDENGWPIDREALIGKEFVHFKGKRYQLLDFARDGYIGPRFVLKES